MENSQNLPPVVGHTVTECRLNIPVSDRMHKAAQERAKTIPGCAGLSDYIRRLIQKDLQESQNGG